MSLSRAYEFRDTLQPFYPKLGKVTTNRHMKRKSDHQRTLQYKKDTKSTMPSHHKATSKANMVSAFPTTTTNINGTPSLREFIRLIYHIIQCSKTHVSVLSNLGLLFVCIPYIYGETTPATHTLPIPLIQASYQFTNQAKTMSHGKTTASSGIAWRCYANTSR